MNAKPNIVIILADDMGYGDLSCYGAHAYETPNMDRVARLGMRFTDMHSTSAVCTPSRYSLLTGRYCWRTRLKKFVLGGFGSPLIEPGRETIASLLQSQGYRTKAVGKWHLGLDWVDARGEPVRVSDADGWETDYRSVDYTKGFSGGPCDLGFDEFFGIAGSLDMPPYCFLRDNRCESLPTQPKTSYYPQQRPGLMSAGWDEREVDQRFASEAVSFINRHSEDDQEPFFLYLAPSSPHRPCLPPEHLAGQSGAGPRGDMVLMVDQVVGEIVSALEANGVLEDTLLMVSSDNGARLVNFDGKDYGHRPNGHLRGQKGDIYDGGHREPFLAMWPKVVPSGSQSDEVLSLADLFATITEITGTPRTAGEDSCSFLSVLKGETTEHPVRDHVIHHSLDGMFSVRKGEWKAVFGNGSGGFSEPARYRPMENEPGGQLFNIVDDSGETLNLWDTQPRVVEELRAILDAGGATGGAPGGV